MELRHWRVDDAPHLMPMILNLLRSPAGVGTKMVASEHNARIILGLGMEFAQCGDPALVAVDREPIAFCCWGGITNPLGLELSGKQCFGVGTYVLPTHRRTHVAQELRQRAVEIARQRGYDFIGGIAYDEPGLLSSLAMGFRAVGTQVEYAL